MRFGEFLCHGSCLNIQHSILRKPIFCSIVLFQTHLSVLCFYSPHTHFLHVENVPMVPPAYCNIVQYCMVVLPELLIMYALFIEWIEDLIFTVTERSDIPVLDNDYLCLWPHHIIKCASLYSHNYPNWVLKFAYHYLYKLTYIKLLSQICPLLHTDPKQRPLQRFTRFSAKHTIIIAISRFYQCLFPFHIALNAS